MLRAELIIAMLALVTSACASVAAMLQTHEAAVQTHEAVVQTQATIEQTKTIAEQLGASVWPYLSFEEVFSPRNVTIAIVNQGLGPALIRRFALHIDGRSHDASVADVVDYIEPARVGREASEFDLGSGSVIRASQSFLLLAVGGAHFDNPRAQQAMRHVHASVCYCSLLGDCWSLVSGSSGPKKLPHC